MLVQDAYLFMFKILSDYYFHINQNESLNTLISDMDPYLHIDRSAADPATYDDWYNIVKKYIKGGKIDKKYISVALQDFLDYYQQEFEYGLEDVIRYFIENRSIFDVS